MDATAGITPQDWRAKFQVSTTGTGTAQPTKQPPYLATKCREWRDSGTGAQGWGNWTQKFRQACVFTHHPRPTASPHMTKLHDWTKALPASLSPLWQWVRPSQLLTHRHLHQEEGCPVWWGQAFRWEQSYWSCSVNWTSLNIRHCWAPCLLPADCVVRVCSALWVSPPEVPVRSPPHLKQLQEATLVVLSSISFEYFLSLFFSVSFSAKNLILPF